MNHPNPSVTTRRSIVKSSSLAAVGLGLSAPGLTAPGLMLPPGRARQDEPLRVALVGCGGRGTGAIGQALSTDGSVKLVAMADAFDDRLQSALQATKASHPDRVDVPKERQFTGFDAAQKAMDCDVDMVILATPPGFRPMHFEYAVSKDLHVFMEKPVATDAPGIRQVLAAAKVAQQKNLKVGVGLQRHHDSGYKETMRRVKEGAIGKVLLLRCYWNSGGVWTRPRVEGMTEMEYQMRNWYYFTWICGDHIAEQHIHNLDVCNWLKDGPPVKAQGVGGRQVRTGPDSGEIFDHHMIEYTYADGTKMLSECRHQRGTYSSVSEHAHGTKGTAQFNRYMIEADGQDKWRYRDEAKNPYQVEHDVLFAAIRSGKVHNEAEYGANSTMTAIMGRMATYSGQQVEWDKAIASETNLLPDTFAWDADPKVMPNADGTYPHAIPGVTSAY
jgi:myo-inositol 2-dehydrogenase/D-chiro-inositol 1-dehydrogenase